MRDKKCTELIEDGEIRLEHCPTAKMVGDIFTKNLNHIMFRRLWMVATGYETRVHLVNFIIQHTRT